MDQMVVRQDLISDIRKLLDLIHENDTFSKSLWWRGFFLAQYVMFFAECSTFAFLATLLFFGRPLSNIALIQFLLSMSFILYFPTYRKVARHWKSWNDRFRPLREAIKTEVDHSMLERSGA